MAGLNASLLLTRPYQQRTMMSVLMNLKQLKIQDHKVNLI